MFIDIFLAIYGGATVNFADKLALQVGTNYLCFIMGYYSPIEQRFTYQETMNDSLPIDLDKSSYEFSR